MVKTIGHLNATQSASGKVFPADVTLIGSLPIHRRSLLTGAAALSGASLLGMPWVKRAAANELEGELFYSNTGGSTQKLFEEDIIPDFTPKTGVKVTYIAEQPSDTAAKMRIQKDRLGYDVVTMAGPSLYSAISAGFLEDLDLDRLPNSTAVPAKYKTEKEALPMQVTICGLLRRTDVFEQKGFPAPTTWFDMWDKKLAEHVGCFSVNTSSGLGFLAKIEQILTGQNSNLDAGFAKLKELRSNMTGYYSSGGAYETAIQQGDVWLGMFTHVRVLQLKRSGMTVDFTIPKEGAYAYHQNLAVAKGAPHPKAAYAWIDHLLGRAMQEKLARTVGYGPVNEQATLPPDMIGLIPPASEVFVPDWADLTARYKDIIDRWNREVEG